MRLILMRHGSAAPRDANGTADADRPLTARGAARVRRAAAGLLALGVRPQRVLTSPLLRARQTAELLARGLGLPRRRIEVCEALLPEAEPALIFRTLRHREEAELLCTGHAPQLDRALALALGLREGRATRLGKAGAACLDLSRCVPPRGRLEWLLEPAALRRLGTAGD